MGWWVWIFVVFVGTYPQTHIHKIQKHDLLCVYLFERQLYFIVTCVRDKYVNLRYGSRSVNVRLNQNVDFSNHLVFMIRLNKTSVRECVLHWQCAKIISCAVFHPHKSSFCDYVPSTQTLDVRAQESAFHQVQVVHWSQSMQFSF